jgi:hypothetical protein
MCAPLVDWGWNCWAQVPPWLLAEQEIRGTWAAGWGTLALINAGLAQAKRRSGLNWFVILLLLGPLATLLLVLGDRGQAEA